jgi:tellurite resistance protein TerC
MALVMVAIGTTDLLFALDRIPAVFGITSEAYLVFAVNAFALMGLRQLYFLLQGLLDRLVYLNRGLAIILAFIGVKLILEALHETTGLDVPEFPIWFSLLFIVVVLIITALASVYSTRRSQGKAAGDQEG